jgi:hypothetical protein
MDAEWAFIIVIESELRQSLVMCALVCCFLNEECNYKI